MELWERIWKYATNQNLGTETINHAQIAWALDGEDDSVTVDDVNDEIALHYDQWKTHRLMREGWGRIVVQEGTNAIGWGDPKVLGFVPKARR